MRRSSALFVLAGLAALIVVAPFISTLIAALIADQYGCVLNEAFAETCVVMGRDIKDTLYVMGTAFWLMIFTALYIPVAIGLVIAGVVTRQKEKRNAETPPRARAVFWLVAVGLLLLPLFGSFSLMLLVAAGATAFYLHRKRQR